MTQTYQTSQKQIEANRRNAKKSTGPRSDAGKSVSRANAIRHGLSAERALLPAEDIADFNAYTDEMMDQLGPVGAIETELVMQIVNQFWRMRRIPVFEAAFVTWLQHKHAKLDQKMAPFKKRYESALPADAPQQTSDIKEPDTTTCALGRAFEAMLQADMAGKLSRYETALRNGLDRSMKTFREEQDRRKNTI